MSDLLVKRQLLKVDRVIGEDTVRETVEAVIKLPFKIIKVFDVIASVTDVETETQEGGVMVSGIIHKQLFVVDEYDKVRHEPEDVPFSVFVDIPGATAAMDAQVDIRILSLDTEVIDGGWKVRQTIVLEIFAKVTSVQQIEVVIDVIGKDIIVKKELLKVDSVVGEDTEAFTLTPTATLGVTARKIFRIIPSVRNVTAEVKENTVIVKGVIHKQIFFVNEEEEVEHVSEDVPFTRAVSIPGARPGMDVQVRVSVVLEDFELVDPPSRTLRQTLVVEAFVKVTEVIQLEVVVDVHGRGIEVIKRLLKVESVVVDVRQKETIRSTVTLDKKPLKILEVVGQIVNLTAEARTDQIIVKGILHKQIFFVDVHDNLLRHQPEDVPFTFVKTARGARPGMNVQVRASIVGEIRTKLDGRELEQTAVIDIFAKVTRMVQLEVVVDVIRVQPVPPKPKPPKPKPPKPKPPVPPKPPVQRYIVQKGDTLWKIAKRFGVSLDALIRANPQIKNPDLIFPGDVVFIPAAPVPKPPTKRYVVQKGDTLFLIAKRFGVSLDALIRANPQIKNPNLIFPGDIVFIP
jgi:spore coat assembly protein SafA